ncbi:unnamed protein product [Dibothriocephalus latus]|uniref:BACK domain-containing protein n=1 Tax=Dibothriocephalus latus TaxID=60516 RepID=A0A3P7PTE1_DIBLA|nr:unnamed protein product [Dibothriocephalus latus]
MGHIYPGQLEVYEANTVGVILLSPQLEMPQVEAWAVSFTAARLDSKNIANNWELAPLLKSDMLRDACLQHIKATFEATVASDVFLHLPSDTVLSLLRADDLQLENEESIYKAIGTWV